MSFIWFILGIITGAVIYKVCLLKRTVYGVLKIDRTNPTKDVYQLCVDDLDTLSNKNKIILDIDSNAILSQK